MADTTILARDFLGAAQALGDQLLIQLRDNEPTLAAAVASAVQSGESLCLAFTMGHEPVIELMARSEHNTVRRVLTIPLQMPNASRSN